MGIFSSKIKYLSYKDIQEFTNRMEKNTLRNPMYIINTLSIEDQQCLIKGTIDANKEERIINNLLQRDKSTMIIVYGRHSCDETVFTKYEKLTKLGFTHVYMYIGGLFEWLCLQDIYSSSFFPTTNSCLEILNYAPKHMYTLP